MKIRDDDQGDALAPEPGVAEAPMGLVDPIVMARSLARAVFSAARKPTAMLGVGARVGVRSGQAAFVAGGRFIGVMRDGPAGPVESDKRFTDRAFQQNPFYYLLAQEYLVLAKALDELLDHASVPEDTDAKARFAGRFLSDALSPTHTLLGNPEAMRRSFDTCGKSVVRGGRNLARDLRRNRGWPAQVDTSPFVLGKNLAATSGKVVHRGDLIEVIQYQPQTDEVHEIPLVFCPPWINKFYLMDLAPGRSLVEWAVQHGHSSFAISYRNPDSSMRDLGFSDYMHAGFLEAVDVVREITASPKVNTVSACLGGTLTAIGLAYCAQTGEDPVNSATFLNTHTDFTHSGALGLFVDDDAVTALERRMNVKGYLEAKEMAHTFDALRAKDLIFGYAVSNWLLGDQPPSFDLLAWNADSTRMPARMHSEYLRSCYIRNEFSRGMFEVDGFKLDPAAVKVDTYVVGAVGDHIVPWASAYKTGQLLGGRSRFVLSSSGHIAGIVNPPSPKARYWTNIECSNHDADEWLDSAKLHKETWWEDWARWMADHGGPLRDSPADLGSSEHPILGDAPGTYVSAIPS